MEEEKKQDRIQYTDRQRKKIVDLTTQIYSRDPKNFRRVMNQFGINEEPPVYPDKPDGPAEITEEQKKTPFESGIQALKDKGAIILFYRKGEAIEDNVGLGSEVKFCIPRRIKVFRAPQYWTHVRGKDKCDPEMKPFIPAGYDYHGIRISLHFSPESPKTKEQVQAIIDKRHMTFLTWACNIFVPPIKPRKPNKKQKKALIKKMKTLKPPRSQRPPRLKNKKEETPPETK